MSGPKTAAFDQFGLVAADGGDLVPASVAAAPNGHGRSQLVDPFGRPWVRLAASGAGMGAVIQPGAINALDSVERASAMAISTLLVATDPAKLYWVQAQGTVATERYLQLYNLAAIPAPAAVPDYSARLFQDGDHAATRIDLTDLGDFFSVGIAAVISDAAFTYDITGVGPDYGISCLSPTCRAGPCWAPSSAPCSRWTLISEASC